MSEMRRLDPHSCAAHDGHIEGCRDCLRAWLDRRAPDARSDSVWASWFDDDSGEYLGERSGRTGPDGVGGKACPCEQCSGGMGR